jgi:hypothetical protein
MHKGAERYNSTHFAPRHLVEGSGEFHTKALFPSNWSPLPEGYQLRRKLVEPHSHSGPCRENKDLLSLLKVDQGSSIIQSEPSGFTD